jgi:F0F1-type ATP synthase membrane subunit b/b'
MKFRIAIPAALALTLGPASAFCAQRREEPESWLTLLFFVINFAVLVFVVARFAAPFASKFLHDWASEIRSTLKTTDDALTRAQQMALRAEADIAKLESEKALMAKEMRETTAREVGRIGEIAKRTAARIQRDAAMASSALAETGRRRIRERLAAVTADLARDLIAKNFGASDESHLIDQFMNELGRESRP